jgi:hypothetical protein
VQVDPRHRHQSTNLRGANRGLCERPVDLGDLAVEEVDLAQAARNGLALVRWQLDALKEAPAPFAGDVVDAGASAAAISFFARLRWRTSWARRAT